MVTRVREAEESLGSIKYREAESVINGHGFTGRSLFFVENIKANEIITEKNVRSIRPGFGLHPKHLKSILGKKVVTDIEKGTPVKMTLIHK